MMIPWLSNVSFGKVDRLVNEETGEKVKVRDDNGIGWEIKQVLHASITY